MTDEPPSATTMVKMPTMLDLSKVRVFADGENQAAARRHETPPPITGNGTSATGELMPFRRRYSDLEAMARAKKGAAAAAAVLWMADAQHRLHRNRKSFEGIANSGGLSRVVGSQDDGAVLHPQQRVVFKSAAVQQEIESKKYSDMVERFQIRRMPHPSSCQTTHSMTTSRSMSTARSVKVYPGVASDVGQGDNHHHTHARQSGHSVSSVGRGSTVGNQPVLIPEDGSWRDLKDAVLSEVPVISWRGWLQQLKDDLRSPISPVSKTSQVRSVVLIAGFVFHMVFFPLETAYFDKTSHGIVAEGFERGFSWLLVFDCFVTLNTSYHNKRGETVTSRKAIARRYARGWLLLDLLSTISVKWMFSRAVTITAGVRWSYAVVDGGLRLPRLIHVTQIAREAWQPRLHESDRSIFTFIFYSRYSHLFSIAKMIVSFVLGAHYMACILKLLSHDVSVTATTPLADYVSNFYDALQLLQGQGVTTTSVAESVFAAISLLVGSVVLATVFGHVAILVSNFNANSTNYQRKMESIFAIMSKLQLPAPLRERIHQYYEHLWREYESLDGEIVSFSKGLSHTLELEVVLFKYMDLIMHVPFWSEASPDFQKQLMLHLSVRVYLPDDFIIRRGEVGDEFFMINRGVCELIRGRDSCESATDPLQDDYGSEANPVDPCTSGNSGKTSQNDCFERMQAPLTSRQMSGKSCGGDVASRSVQVLHRGQAFGEMALIMNYERTADVRALTYVEMCVLKRSDVQAIFVKHPKDRSDVIKSMLTRVMENNERNQVDCPLRNVVAGVFGVGNNSKQADSAQGSTFSATHVALLLSAAIDMEAKDASIIFGVDESLKQKLVDLRKKDEEAYAPPPQKVADQNESTCHEQPSVRLQRADSSSTQLTSEMSKRLEELHRTQKQLLSAMEGLRRDLRAAREYDKHIFS